MLSVVFVELKVKVISLLFKISLFQSMFPLRRNSHRYNLQTCTYNEFNGNGNILSNGISLYILRSSPPLHRSPRSVTSMVCAKTRPTNKNMRMIISAFVKESLRSVYRYYSLHLKIQQSDSHNCSYMLNNKYF